MKNPETEALPPDMEAMQMLLNLPEPERSAAVNWLRERIRWEARCAAALDLGLLAINSPIRLRYGP